MNISRASISSWHLPHLVTIFWNNCKVQNGIKSSWEFFFCFVFILFLETKLEYLTKKFNFVAKIQNPQYTNISTIIHILSAGTHAFDLGKTLRHFGGTRWIVSPCLQAILRYDYYYALFVLHEMGERICKPKQLKATHLILARNIKFSDLHFR